MRESSLGYGPTPFCNFHSWFKMDAFDKLMEETWHSIDITDTNGLICMKKKLQLLKNAIKIWSKENKRKLNEAKFTTHNKLMELDKAIDQGCGNDDILNQRTTLMKELNDINSIEVSELSQIAQVRWSIKGDENSKYFHGILNSERTQLAIRGILMDGDWIIEPTKVKNEFLSHFTNQFLNPQSSRVSIDFQFPTHLNSEQVEDLEHPITYDEIKKTVWECGTNKSPGPGGFSFEFF
ncbi:hypothetical protein Tco_1179719 [Tanacetum coccineum]